MSDKSGYDFAVGPCRASMRFLGVWPDPVIPDNMFAVFRFTVAALTMILFCNIAQSTMVLKVWGDLNSVVEILTTTNVPIFIALIKFVITRYNREVLKELIVLMVEDWSQPNSNQDIQTMWKTARFSRKFSIICLCLSQGTLTSQLIMVVVFGTDSKGATERALYMTAYYPYDTQKSPNYEITWLNQWLSNVYASIAFCSVDAFFAVLVLHLCGQLTILRRSIMVLVSEPDKIQFSTKIARIVERHKHLSRVARTIEDSFNMMFLAQMIASSIVLCLQGYQLVLIMTSGDGIPLLELIYMLYFTGAFAFSLFVYCYVAEVLQYESMEIGNAAYECSWNDLQPLETKLLVLVMIRAKQPFQITAGKFAAFSLGLYCNILKTSGGYLSMLLAMKDRLVDT